MPLRGTNSSGGFFWNEDKDTVFAYQIGAGIGINAGQHLAFDLGYRYFGTSDIQFDQTTEADFSSHNLLAGVRYRF